jgi:anhydro-N-acetylmuramic acid kinase
MKSFYRVLGLMSGTSLDGLDVAQCTFNLVDNKWQYAVERAKTFSYSPEWKLKLATAENLSGLDFMLLNNEVGKVTGDYINQFLGEEKSGIDFIASHGQTIFHQPNLGLTTQIGSGAIIAATTGIPVVCDFRSLDVALGGQGAPLVPIGDKLLFGEYDYCLNLGGFANISFDTSEEKRIAFDICPVNIIINYLIKDKRMDYDPEGSIGRQGIVSQKLLEELNNLSFYHQSGPKSLGKEWVLNQMLPIIKKYQLATEDSLRTVYEHISIQIGNILNNQNDRTILITGGGAHNQFLIELLHLHHSVKIIIPEKEIIDFKEALIFAFLGLLRYRNEINSLSSVTGAKQNNVGGVIYFV